MPGVNLKTLVALTEDGIPVFDLLGKQLGVSADRIRELANSGQLGNDSIKLLIASLGNLRAGAAANELGDFDSQMTKLKDSVKEFLEIIAESGALQVFRDGIHSLNVEIDEAAKSGKLKELAKSIGDGIVSAAGAIKGAIGFVIDYAGAIKRLGEAYLTLKAINLSSTLMSGASAILTTAKATETAAAGAAVATGWFGKLIGFIGKLPKNIVLTVIAVGVDLILENLDLIYSRRTQMERAINEAALANVDANNKLQVSIEKIKKAYKEFADIKIQSSEELKSQTAEQLAAYEKQLEGARTFYNALSVQANQAGDALKLKDANTHLDAINAEIGKVNTQLVILRNVGADAATGLNQGAKEFASKITELGNDTKAIGDFISKAFEGFDLKKQIAEVGEFALGLDTVAARGGKTAQILDSTLLESLKKLSGQDLLDFQSNAIVDGAQHGQAAQEDVQRAFLAYATAARQAAADSSQSNKDTLEEQLSVLASVNRARSRISRSVRPSSC